MSTTYNERYGPRPSIGVYSNHPELVTDTNNLWTVQHLGSLDPEFYALIQADPKNLLRRVVRMHDKGIDKEFGHIMVMIGSNPVDLSYVANWIDLEHTTFVESKYNFAVYRRDKIYNVKTIDFDGYPETTNLITRQSNPRLGVIFIDCWPIDFDWQHVRKDFDFYKNMLEILNQYSIDAYVFHTSFLSLDVITPDITRYIQQLVANNTDTTDLQDGFKELLEFTGDEQLAPELAKLAQDPKSVLIPGVHGFKKLMQREKIDQWIVVGMHWGICTHEKALGFYNLKKIKEQNPGMKIYSIPECTAQWVSNFDSNRVARLCNKSDYDNDSLEWDYYGNIAQLK
jgi:hypothetical protein